MWIDGYGGIRVVRPNLAGLADDGLLAQLHAELDGDDVARHVERAPERHRPVELEVVVLRRPGRRVGGDLDGERIVHHDVRERIAGLDRGRVHDRLEGGARLAERLGGAVELAVLEVAPAHHRADVAGLGVERDDQTLQVGRGGACCRCRARRPGNRDTAGSVGQRTCRRRRSRWPRAGPRARARRPAGCRGRAWCRSGSPTCRDPTRSGRRAAAARTRRSTRRRR